MMATNSPQLAALTVEPVGAEQPAFVPLTGRLVWDEDATVRVFTPFAGIVRKLFVERQPARHQRHAAGRDSVPGLCARRRPTRAKRPAISGAPTKT